MNTIHDFVRVHLPNYFRSIPVPKDVSGLTNLSGSECLRLMAFFLLVFMILYSLIRTIFFSSASSSKQPPKTLEKLDDRVVNLTILKEKEKVATAKDIEDLDEKQAFCRCWRSAKFPMCDGTHNKHNKETGDNVGPLVLSRRDKAPESKKDD